MADKKYIGKVINMPRKVSEDFAAVRTIIASKIGFEPSASETISFLISQYKCSLTTTELSSFIGSSPSSQATTGQLTLPGVDAPDQRSTGAAAWKQPAD